ncbi:uncharacterized protein LOC111701017 [Eurytemora carolleeae]|uniref:uncharacterized protein LOC111701017 n=1 Tax=Eurytemora carolleeae TaxID=1294199 RepID=UPI000C76F587|nr:uncharacterized protein LOC111701017 [Eurytemora carolleeae]|eukprot:XP_023327893.1 uncharacterized protein LOC111701017 [Eurytemora affinis]
MDSLDLALDELGMLSTATKYKMEFIQSIETDLEERRAQSLKSARLKAGSSTAHSSSFISDPEQDGLGNFSRLDGSCSRSMVYMIGEDESQRSQININPSFVTNIKICSPRIPGRFSSQRLNSDIIENRTRSNSRELLCLRDCVGPRFTRILNIPYTSPYTRPYTSPYSVSNSSLSCPRNPSNSYPSLSSLSLTYPSTSTSSPGSTTIKLSGVLTSFKHRTWKTRARVRFSHREENTEDIIEQLANIKLDISSLSSSDPNRNLQSFVQSKQYTKERFPRSGHIRLEHRSRMLSLDSRSRLQLEEDEPSLNGDLSCSLNQLDLEQS